MKLSILDIQNRGVANKECLVLHAEADGDLASYVVLKTIVLGLSSVAAGSQQCYWFASKKVKKGDFVFLFTGSGVPNESPMKNGSPVTAHFFYWGSQTTLWNVPADCAVLIEASEWATFNKAVPDASGASR